MKARFATLFIASALLLNACGLPAATPAAPTPDVNFIYTAAAQTITANLAQTAAAVTPTLEATSTPEMTATPAPVDAITATVDILTPKGSPTPGGCDNAVYVSDMNVPDGTQMAPGQDFLKTWKVRNTGTCTWGVGYSIIYGDYDNKMNGQPVALESAVLPGSEIEVSVQFTAPSQAGEYLSAWRMANAAGAPFGEFFYVKIVVQ
jgi:hypothetical protein